MELLLSNFPPAVFPCNSLKNYMEKAIKDCKVLKIASGYISSDALIDLKRIIELNSKPRLELLIGMHYFDGFTKDQYEAACALDNYLLTNNLGFIYVADTLKFHGKMYSFTMNDSSVAAVVGSSNLGSLYGSVNKLYESDILLSGEESNQVHTAIDQIIRKIGSPISEVSITEFIKINKLLENHENVKKVENEELVDILNKRTSTNFNIDIKPTPRSNLNPYFGKGRDNHRGYVAPRPWYEVEIIVSKSITSKPGFPYKKSFIVVTDDGWSFKCETNGDYSKNLRSKDDLKILGKWIKGRMEESGALKIGEQVTDKVIAAYGKNFINLCATTYPDIWYLDFSSK